MQVSKKLTKKEKQFFFQESGKRRFQSLPGASKSKNKVANVSRSLYSLEVRLNSKKFKQGFLETGKIFSSF